jgi:hypothetical protein
MIYKYMEDFVRGSELLCSVGLLEVASSPPPGPILQAMQLGGESHFQPLSVFVRKDRTDLIYVGSIETIALLT